MKIKISERLIIISALIIMAVIYYGSRYYNRIYTPVILPEAETDYHLFVPSGTDLNGFIKLISKEALVADSSGFRWLAERKNLQNHLNSGHYLLKNNMVNNDLINLIRSGEQEPVKIVFHNLRSIEQLASTVSSHIEVDSITLVSFLKDESNISASGWSSQTIPALFIPNSYEIYWNTSAQAFFDRMEREYKSFWNNERLKKAEELGLSPVEVSTLASIVDEETYRDDEMPMIAAVYLNRLKKRYRLQADPTIKFAKGNFEMNRVLKADLQIDSPYNTYRHYGLPPGPISIPSIASIDAVLSPNKQGYLYFCAKEDFSGYHNFAKTLVEHNRNARKYQNALNKRRIYN
ncbi:MAG: endolytic transglycosylase MltG [Bacteroidota bacterium]|nr:endolytic transglycosylase MltG [Bacteroidota bacterium]